MRLRWITLTIFHTEISQNDPYYVYIIVHELKQFSSLLQEIVTQLQRCT